jgi:hypothetical protein
MMESEWLATADADAMLEYLDDNENTSERKLRLFCGACCRRVWDRLQEEKTRRAVATSERFADGEATLAEYRATSRAAYEPWMARSLAASGGIWDPIEATTYGMDTWPWPVPGAADLLRDLFGPLPFRDVALDPAWLTETVRSVAQATYQERELPSGTLEPQRLSILGDALEEAGAGGDIVAHLRSPGPHFRGCWCVDMLTGRG